MKTKFFLLFILAFVFSACSQTATLAPPGALAATGIADPTPAALANPAAPAAPAPQSTAARPPLDTAYADALSERNQLALGILLLPDSLAAVTADQAQTMLPLWQLLLNLQGSGTAADAEVSAVLRSIEDSLTNEQIAAIQAMQLTQADLQAWASTSGITFGSGSGTGQGQGQGMSPEARATRQAEEGRTPSNAGGGASTALVTAVIEYLAQQIP